MAIEIILGKNSTTIKLRVSNGSIVNYCYLVFDNATKYAVIIDPAWDLKCISNTIEQYCLNLKSILITHHHYDHFNLAEKISLLYNIEIHISELELKTYRLNLENANIFLSGLILSIGTTDIVAIPTPGHTIGSTCFLIEGHLFTGDTLFIEGCGLCFGEGACPYDMFNTLMHLKKTMPNNTRVFPGHKYDREPGQYFSYLKENNIYLAIDDKKTFVEYRMRESQKNLFLFK